MPRLALAVRPGSTAALAWIVLGTVCAAGAARLPPQLAPHPRLRLNQGRLADVKRLIATDPTAAAVAAAMGEYGATLLGVPVVNCSLAGVEHSELSQARSVLDRTYTLGMLWRLDGDPRWARRAIVEMLHVTADPSCASWNPAHFLDVAEMMHAVAIGYDWLYDAPAALFPPESRSAIAAGLAARGLGAAAKSWKNTEFTTVNNWNLVCNGGMIAASLVLMDSAVPEQSQLAAAVFHNATARVRLSLMTTYAPAGAWPEGPTYWGYATKYALVAADVLKTATGDDQGLGSAPGLAGTATWKIHNTGPLDKTFNWGDSDNVGSDEFVPNFFNLARLPGATPRTEQLEDYLGRQIFSRSLRCEEAGCAQALLGYAPGGAASDLEALPTCAAFQLSVSGWNNRTALGYFRSDWRGVQWNVSAAAGPEQPVWLAFKGGNGQANHNDADAGTFVLEMAGHRWATDLGADSYGLEGYWDKSSAHGKRYSFYRKSTRGHNTLTFDGHDLNPGWSSQDVSVGAVAAITSFSCGAEPHAIVDLSPVYAHAGGPDPPSPATTKVLRGFSAVQDFSRVIIADEWAAPGASNVTWAMHFDIGDTNVTVSSDGASAVLTTAAGSSTAETLTASIADKASRRTVVATIEQPRQGARFTVQTPVILPPQDKVGGLRKLVIVVDPRQTTSLTVSFALPGTPPLGADINRPSSWGADGVYSIKEVVG